MAAIVALFGALSVAQIVTLVNLLPVVIQIIQIIVPLSVAGARDLVTLLHHLHDEIHSHLATSGDEAAAARHVQSEFPHLFAGKPRPVPVYVHTIQQALNRWAASLPQPGSTVSSSLRAPPPLQVDGKYGPLTRERLRLFQKSTNLPSDGVATVATLQALGVYGR